MLCVWVQREGDSAGVALGAIEGGCWRQKPARLEKRFLKSSKKIKEGLTIFPISKKGMRGEARLMVLSGRSGRVAALVRRSGQSKEVVGGRNRPEVGTIVSKKVLKGSKRA